MSYKKVFIVRGPSGCGKSTYIETNILGLGSVEVCSADHFFYGPDGYEFDIAKISQAHAACMAKYISCLFSDICSYVVVDNTMIQEWECRNYISLAAASGADIEMVQFVPRTLDDIRALQGRNLHGTPDDIVTKMAVHMYEYRQTDLPVGTILKTLDISV